MDEDQTFRCPDCDGATWELRYVPRLTAEERSHAPAEYQPILEITANDSPIMAVCTTCPDWTASVTQIELNFARRRRDVPGDTSSESRVD